VLLEAVYLFARASAVPMGSTIALESSASAILIMLNDALSSTQLLLRDSRVLAVTEHVMVVCM